MARQTKALVQEAEALGIDVDGRWGDETIQEKIDDAAAARAAALTGSDGDEGATADDGEADEADAGDPAASEPAGSQAAIADGEGSADGAVSSEPAGAAPGVEAGTGPADGLDEADQPDADDAVVLPLTDHGGDVVVVAEGPETAAALKLQIEALTDGEGDTATSGEAGDAEADHGDGSADGASEEEADTEDRRLAEARASLTRPIVAAYQAAGVVFGALTMDGGDRWQGSFDADWFGRDHMSGHPIPLVRHATEFVRQWPDAPAGALYGHVQSGGGVNLVLERPWSDLPLAERLAWRTFRDVLVTIDTGMAAEWKATTPERVARTIPIDETTLEEVDEPFALTEVAGGAR